VKLAEREINRWMFFTIAGIFLVLIFGAMNWRENRVINKIIVKGNETIPDDIILNLAGVKIGEKFTLVNLSELRRKVESHKFIKQANVYTNLPDVLLIEVEERKPIAMVIFQGKIYYVDYDGYVIPYDDVKRIFSVPLLNLDYKPVNVFADSADALRKQYELVKLAIEKDVYNLISEVKFKNGEFIIFAGDSAVVVFLGEGNLDKKFLALKKFWAQEVQGKASPVYVDLRYEGKIYAKFKSKN